MSEDSTLLLSGRFELRAVLGAGGMATVYRAWDTRLQVERAVKVLATGFASRKKLRDRFLLEARTMVKLQHPNIVQVTDIGEDGLRPYIVMELVDGGTLIERMEQVGPLDPESGRVAGVAILRALEHAHARGVVHRDVKPHNVLVTPAGVPKLMDFGIAQVTDDAHLTRTGATLGTPAYMPPEQNESARRADARSDLYAVGASMLHLLSGKVATGERTETLDSVEPEPLRELLRRALQDDPEQRFPTATAMREALEALDLPPTPEGSTLHVPRAEARTLPGDMPARGPRPGVSEVLVQVSHIDGEPSEALRQGAVELGLRRRRRQRMRRVLGGLLVLLLAVGALSLRFRDSQAPELPAEAPELPPPSPAPALVLPPPRLQEPPLIAPPSIAPKASTASLPSALPTPVPGAEPEPGTPAAEPPAKGRVVVLGDVDRIELVGDSGSFPPGSLPAGSYTVKAWFGERSVVAGSVAVSAGGTTTLRCDPSFQLCQVL